MLVTNIIQETEIFLPINSYFTHSTQKTQNSISRISSANWHTRLPMQTRKIFPNIVIIKQKSDMVVFNNKQLTMAV